MKQKTFELNGRRWWVEKGNEEQSICVYSGHGVLSVVASGEDVLEAEQSMKQFIWENRGELLSEKIDNYAEEEGIEMDEDTDYDSIERDYFESKDLLDLCIDFIDGGFEIVDWSEIDSYTVWVTDNEVSDRTCSVSVESEKEAIEFIDKLTFDKVKDIWTDEHDYVEGLGFFVDFTINNDEGQYKREFTPPVLKDTKFSFRIDSNTLEQLKSDAESRNTTAAKIINKLIKDYLK